MYTPSNASLPPDQLAHNSEPGDSFELLTSLRLENARYWLLNRHLERLETAACHFNFPLSLADVAARLEGEAQSAPSGIWKVRCLVNAQGETRLIRAPIDPDGKFPLSVALASMPVSRADTFLYYKTTRRDVYETRLAQTQRRHGEVYDALLCNEENEVTEFTRANVVVELRGRLLTPPVACGLLAGVLRAELLAKGEVQERVMTRADLAQASRLWMINSVRGWLPASLLDTP